MSLVVPAPSYRSVNAHVLFNDTFAATPLPWKVTAGTGAITRTTTDAETHSFGGALKLTTSTVPSEACEVHRFMAKTPRSSIIAFGGRFAIMDENISNIAFYLGFRDGTNWYRAKLLHVYSTNLWQYDAGESGGASNVTLLTRDASEVSSRAVWHTFLLVADFAATRYVDVQVDEQEFYEIVSQNGLRQSADVATPNLLDFAIETTNLGGTPSAGVIIFDQLFGVGFDKSQVLANGVSYWNLCAPFVNEPAS